MPPLVPQTELDPSALADLIPRSRGATEHPDATVFLTQIETPLGPMVAGSDAKSLLLLEFVDRDRVPAQLARLARWLQCSFQPGDTPILTALRQQLDEYFRGARADFDVPLEARGTPFQRQVWKALGTIPCGSTQSYADVARAIGRPTAVRAVARANGDNRISILIPCHRVVGSDGRLVGYGGGLWRKERLLAIETRSALSEPQGVSVFHDHGAGE